MVLLVCASVSAPARAEVQTVRGDYRSDRVTFTVTFSEASSYHDGWDFQLFIDADGNHSTGYARGFDLIVRGVELASPDEVYLRETLGGDGAGGWGDSVATVPFIVADARHLTFDVPLGAEFGLADGRFRFDFESYYDGALQSAVRDMFTTAGTCTADGDCDDDLFCNGAEFCLGGTCQSGSDPCPGTMCDEDLDDCVTCTGDADCDDGLFCNGDESCAEGKCESGDAPCPTGTCNEALDRCDTCIVDADCDDGLFCNGNEFCVDGSCLSGEPPCPPDSCNETLDRCDSCSGDADCDDGLFCNGSEYCIDGTCHSGVIPCPPNSCNESLDRCDVCYGDADCDDGLFCNGSERCVDGGCEPGAEPCPDRPCDEATDQCEPLECVTSEPVWQSRNFELRSERFTIRFNATPHGGSIDALTGLSFGEAEEFADSVLTVRFNIHGRIDAWNADALKPWDPDSMGWYDADTEIPYTPGTNYEFQVVVDPPTGRYDVYVTPDGGSEQLLAQGFTFRTPMGGMDGLDHWHTWAGIGSHEVCDPRFDECRTDADCDDGDFCNGRETCTGGTCQWGADPCPGQGCSELGDECYPMFDADDDGDVDLDDLADFIACLTGAGRRASVPCRDAHDRDGDRDVDLLDYADFQVAFTGGRLQPQRFGDWDRDGHVDLDDFGSLPGCLAGPGRETDPACRIYDADHDGDVDTLDFASMQKAIGGADVTWVGDWDESGFVDLADCQVFTICMQGPDEVMAGGCVAFDFNHDARIDLADFAAMQRAVAD
jgi:hypothetical protein